MKKTGKEKLKPNSTNTPEANGEGKRFEEENSPKRLEFDMLMGDDDWGIEEQPPTIKVPPRPKPKKQTSKPKAVHPSGQPNHIPQASPKPAPKAAQPTTGQPARAGSPNRNLPTYTPAGIKSQASTPAPPHPSQANAARQMPREKQVPESVRPAKTPPASKPVRKSVSETIIPNRKKTGATSGTPAHLQKTPSHDASTDKRGQASPSGAKQEPPRKTARVSTPTSQPKPTAPSQPKPGKKLQVSPKMRVKVPGEDPASKTRIISIPEKETAPSQEKTNGKKRIGWVDIAKALAIVAIIVGHFGAFSAVAEEASYLPWAHQLLEFCYSFHVPLFFILSGYCMKDALPSPKKFGSFAAKTWLPYVVAGIFTVLVGVNLSQTNSWESWWAALLYGTGGYGVGDALGESPFGDVAIGVIWFLPALFFAKTIVMLTAKIPPLVRLPLMALCFAGGSIWACSFYLPLSFQEGLACAWYVYCGCVLKRHDAITRMTSIKESKGKTEKIGWALLHIYVLVFGVWYMWQLTTEQMAEPNYCLSWYHQIPVDLLGTVCAAIVVIFLCVWIERGLKALGRSGKMISDTLQMLGRNTLPVFAYHGVSLACADNLILYLGDVCEQGADPATVLFVAILANLGLACGLSFISYLTPGLRYVFFPGKKSPWPAVKKKVSSLGE